MRMDRLLTRLRTFPDCTLFPPIGLPEINADHQLPHDLRKFYQCCGGAILFESSKYPLYIMTPDDFSLANPILLYEPKKQDLSEHWYIFAQAGNDQHVTIDLHPKRVGLCYDSGNGRHGVMGKCSVIALSYTQWMMNVIKKRNDPYWLSHNFKSYGDAYERKKKQFFVIRA